MALSMGEGNFLLVAHEHVQWPAEGLSWTGAPGQHIPRRPFTRLGASTPNLIQSALHLPPRGLFIAPLVLAQDGFLGVPGFKWHISMPDADARRSQAGSCNGEQALAAGGRRRSLRCL